MDIPKMMFFTKGVGYHRDELTSFEWALKNAGIGALNLVTVSSIYPPRCRIITKQQGVKLLQDKDGAIVHLVLARISTNEPYRYMAASIGFAKPKDIKLRGYLSEFHGFGYTEEEAGDKAEDMAAQMLASTLGIDLNPSEAWKEKEKLYKASGKIIYTRNYTEFAKGHKDWKVWTTTIAAAVFIEDELKDEIKKIKEDVKGLKEDVQDVQVVQELKL
jgi:arginine decarboxylase